jgi:hypothetical protein
MAVQELEPFFATVPQCFQDHANVLLRNRDAFSGYDRRFCFPHGDQRLVYIPETASKL